MEFRNASSWEKIFELKRNGENKRVEFKESSFIRNNEEIAAQLTSFSNRYGGRILIGVRDDENLQNWDAIEGAKIDRDRNLLHISNIATNNCSPPVQFSSAYLESEKGDVLILNVERRKDMPHAVVEYVGNEIKKRIYYVRIESGKRLVNDRLLDYMFKNLEDPYFEHRFAIGLQYIRDNLNISGIMFDIPYRGIWTIASFIKNLNEEDIKFIKEEEPNRIGALFVELLPYAMLEFLSQYFYSSWDINIEKIGGSTTISPLKDIDKIELKLDNILNPPENTLLSNLSLDIKSILRRRSFKLSLPPETKFEITLLPGIPPISKIQLSRENSFEFNFSFQRDQWMVGASALTPLYGVPDNIEERMKLQELIASSFVKTNLSCKFAFPDIDDPLFEKVYRWGRLNVDIIKEHWDWDVIIQKMPERKLFSIENYLKNILDIVKKERKL